MLLKTHLTSRNDFSSKVLSLTKRIPKGKVTTYKAIAEKLNSKAYRAVGTALKNNKQPIVIPCHRVINSDGKLGAYCGIKNSKKKAQLLKKEGIPVRNNKIDFKYMHKF